MIDEEELIAAAAGGNEEAFLILIEREKEKLMRIAMAYLHQEADALEAIQETVCRAWLKRRSLRNPHFMRTWIVRILIHVCTDELRRRKKMNRGNPETDHHLHDSQIGADGVNNQESGVVERLMLDEIVESLDEPYRHVVRLKYYEDMTIHDIAAVLGKPDGTIRTWIHKALKQMRTALGGGNKQQ
ncbi:sigma-70 family RNA polymerase sigma factor [Paenibacillus aurantiacus]|uniref:Sigma-70 family RNA polymerase sigma factor n=1 Tax=Paenibacillus aurantiacus TaxID=1936118 RepID=A0ABV5KI90_9BACL